MSSISCPNDSMVGSLGDLARVLSAGTEVPAEFFFASALTLFGSRCGSDLRLDIGFDVQPRLYTVLLGDSYGAKKSTAMKKTIKFFETVPVHNRSSVLYGVGSGEGLANAMQENPYVLLAFDELRAFLDKTKVQSSVLLAMATALFEQNQWQNVTKSKKQSRLIANGHLSILGCCTTETYSGMWTSEAISIGFPNRLFIINADRNGKVAWPTPADEAALQDIRIRIQKQLAVLPKTLKISEDGKQRWAAWYDALTHSTHSKRLDTIGYRLLALIALTTDKDIIDAETVDTVIRILNYELSIRMLTDPIDADNRIARLEEAMRRHLKTKGSLTKNVLRRAVHADRDGLWAFEAALKNLKDVGDIEFKDKAYHFIEA